MSLLDVIPPISAASASTIFNKVQSLSVPVKFSVRYPLYESLCLQPVVAAAVAEDKNRMFLHQQIYHITVSLTNS